MPLRVRYVECDMQGRAFSGHYLTWVDMAHTEALRELVGGYQVLTGRGIDVVVVAAELQFRRPAHFDDELVVNVAIEQTGAHLAAQSLPDRPRIRTDRRGGADPRLRGCGELRETALAGLVPRRTGGRRGHRVTMPVFADVDTGVDDAMALVYLLASDDADLVGIASTGGNVDVDQVCRNNLGLLQLCGATGIPVSRGITATGRADAHRRGHPWPAGLGYAELPAPGGNGG